MSNQLPKNACAYPFKARMLMHGTPATPCCRFHDRFLSDADKDPVTLFADIKETMMRNEWHAGCYKCQQDEEARGHSMRTNADEFFDDFTDTERLEYMEITVGRLCNLACVTCGFEYSHKWDDDSVTLNLPSLWKLEHYKKHSELDLDSFDLAELKDLKHIKVTGGEPLLHKQFLNFIVRLADAGIAPQVNIEIFTNCTWWPKKVEYDALLQFKSVRITASIDAHNELNTIIRYPAKWSVMESTLDKWIATSKEHEDFEVLLACTVSVLNAPVLYDFMVWARQEKRLPVTLQAVYEPHEYALGEWPQWFKERVRNAFNDRWIQTPAKVRERIKRAHAMINGLCDTTVDNDNSQEYLDKINQLLNVRGQTLEGTEFFKLLQ